MKRQATPPKTRKRTLLLALLGAGIQFSSSGEAQAQGSRSVAVSSLVGPKHAALERSIVAALRESGAVEVMAPKDWKAHASRTGVDPRTPEGFFRLTYELGLSSVVEGEIKNRRGRWSAVLMLRGGASHGRMKIWRLRARSFRGLKASVKRGLWQKFGARIAMLPVPSPNDRRMVVLHLFGTKGPRFRKKYAAHLLRSPEVTIIPFADAKDYSVRQGGALGDAETRADIARAFALTAFIRGELSRVRGKYVADLRVTAPDGETVLTELSGKHRRLPTLAKIMADKTIQAMTELPSQNEAPAMDAPPVAAAPPPRGAEEDLSPPETAAEDTAESDDSEDWAEDDALASALGAEPSPTEETKNGGTTAYVGAFTPVDESLPRTLTVSAGLQIFSRRLRYNDDIFEALRPYTLSGAPALHLNGRWFPLMHFTRADYATYVGVDMDFEYALGLQSTNPDGVDFGTTAYQFLGSLVGRLPVGRHELGARFGFGLQDFSISEEGATAVSGVPSTTYSFLRIGIEGKYFILDPLYVGGTFGGRFVLSSGDIASDIWFPRASSIGFDAGIDVGYRILSELEIQLSGAFRRYGYSLNPEPGDTNVAGGATDQYLSATIGVAWLFGG